MRLLTSLVFSVLTATAALAENRPVVVELFTSQGCSSCPPADAILHDLAKDPNVIALALHVDYWDYIGWKDSFANPAFTKRQRSYARTQAERMIYTPQLMVNGVEHAVGNRKSDVRNLVADHKGKSPGAQIAVKRNGGQLSIQLGNARDRGDFEVHVVSYVPKSRVAIKRGENAGKTISYANVVSNWQTLGTWSGSGSKTLRGKVQRNAHVVVLLQKRGHGEIVAAVHAK